jgi:hypothetical protein
MVKRTLVTLVALGALLAGASVAAAAGVGASLFGSAVAEPADVRLTSDLTDTSTANDFGGIRLTPPAGTTFSQLTSLSTDFDPIAGGCGGGSPRFSIQLAGGKNVFVYVGPSPSFTGCALNTWQSTGNLIGNNDTGRYDTSQVQAGTQSNTYAGALALVGSQQVTEIDLVADSGWFFNPKVQTVLVRNVQVNGETFYAPASPKQNPAKLCLGERHSIGASAFADKWGKNHNKKNAYGRCVAAMAHSHHHS